MCPIEDPPVLAEKKTTVDVRWAQPGEGPVIQAIMTREGWPCLAELDWSLVQASWLVATLHEIVVGAIQVCCGIPVSRLEFLCLEPALSQTKKTMVVKSLLGYAMLVCKRYGATAVSGLVPEELMSYRQILVSRGAIPAGSGTIYLKRI